MYRLYITGSMGYHTGSLLTHLFAKEKHSDYVEMTLHHLATFFLFAFSYLCNLFMGGVIAYLHDIADVFLSITRFFSETKYKKITIFFFILTIIAWCHTRIYVFSQIVYMVGWKH